MEIAQKLAGKDRANISEKPSKENWEMPKQVMAVQGKYVYKEIQGTNYPRLVIF